MEGKRPWEDETYPLWEESVYQKLVPPGHFLRRLDAAVDWEAFSARLLAFYKKAPTAAFSLSRSSPNACKCKTTCSNQRHNFQVCPRSIGGQKSNWMGKGQRPDARAPASGPRPRDALDLRIGRHQPLEKGMQHQDGHSVALPTRTTTPNGLVSCTTAKAIGR